jgi:hypothetical protein
MMESTLFTETLPAAFGGADLGLLASFPRRLFRKRRSKRRGRIPPPLCPTQALPGSREKVDILAQRARQRVALWHPDDVRAPYLSILDDDEQPARNHGAFNFGSKESQS